MQPRPDSTPRWIRWYALAVFVLALIARLAPGPRTIDDSHITYRYARNLLQGHGLVFNPGERVLGTTTPLYAFLMAGLGSLSGGTQAPFSVLSISVNALADGLVCLLLLRLGMRLGVPYAAAGAALVWAVLPYSVTFAIGGLETSLFVLLLVSMGVAHVEGRRILAALLGGLALLTRPDALILIGLLALDRMREILTARRRGDLRQQGFVRELAIELAVFAVPVLAWVIFSTAYFGSPLPHSVTAKSVAYRLSPEEGFIRLMQHYATPFMENETFGAWSAAGLFIYPFLFLVGALRLYRLERRTGPLLAYPWLYFAAFAIANPLIFRWYLTPPLPFYILAILAGAETAITSLTGWLGARSRQGSSAPNRLAQAALIFFVILAPVWLVLQDWSMHPDHGLTRPAPDMAWYKLELLYRQAADELASDIQSQSTPPLLAAGDVGVLGFFSGARILDTVGLNSPVSTSYYPADPHIYVTNYAIPADLILDQRPDYVVILEVYGREGLFKDPRFQAEYFLRQKIPTDIYGSDGMLILERRGR